MPLSFVIARYFAYAFAAVATAWLASFMALSAAINAGFVYEASWGPANAREVAEGLARDGVCGQQDVPTAYRYLILNKDGYVLMTDLEGTRLEDATEMARAALAVDPGTVEIEGGGSGLTYAAFPLKGGGACALISEYLPQWVSRDLAGLLPNPQNLMLVGAAAGSALALALVARRASRVISRKMAPLAEAAERVGAGELDFAVGSTNVREVNDVLAAMDAADVHGVSHITGRDGRHADLPRRVARGPLGRGAGAARAGGVARPRPQDAAHRAARQRRLRGGGAGRRERRRPRGRRARHSRRCRKARRLRAPAHRGLARVRRGGEGPHAAGPALRTGPRRGRPDRPGARRDARRGHGAPLSRARPRPRSTEPP